MKPLLKQDQGEKVNFYDLLLQIHPSKMVLSAPNLLTDLLDRKVLLSQRVGLVAYHVSYFPPGEEATCDKFTS